MKLFNAMYLKPTVVILAALCSSVAAFAQTPAQLLQGLTPAQRSALLQGVSGGDNVFAAEPSQAAREATETPSDARPKREADGA